jgi:hypothetical protein
VRRGLLSNKEQFDTMRGIVSAVLVDLCKYMVKLEAPIVIGGEYPAMSVLTIFENYCYDRDIQISPASDDIWKALYESGKLTTAEINKPERRLRFKNVT